jgi:hypothetical protein
VSTAELTLLLLSVHIAQCVVACLLLFSCSATSSVFSTATVRASAPQYAYILHHANSLPYCTAAVITASQYTHTGPVGSDKPVTPGTAKPTTAGSPDGKFCKMMRKHTAAVLAQWHLWLASADLLTATTSMSACAVVPLECKAL